ncbi:hypothetical protein DRO42_07680 [Candidatus Bathyarchaeota archaeon]|nr:MAG: hypothetical protein DRO42_07680 [Candidatus Bathyarchaeota archaeon]
MSDWILERALNLALEMEEQSIRLYTSAQDRVVNPGSRQFLKELAAKYREKQIGRMFARLAQEELKHKHRLEREYDDVVLKEM